MPSFVVTRTYSSAARSARSFDSSTLMPPNSTNFPLLLTSMVGWILTVVMGSPRGVGRTGQPAFSVTCENPPTAPQRCLGWRLPLFLVVEDHIPSSTYAQRRPRPHHEAAGSSFET